MKASASEIEKIFLFCLSWSIGAFLEIEDRVKFDSFIRTNETNQLPMPRNSIFSYVVDGDAWKPWQDLVESYALPENYTNEYSSILVPTVDYVRTNFLIKTVASQVRLIFERNMFHLLSAVIHICVHNTIILFVIRKKLCFLLANKVQPRL